LEITGNKKLIGTNTPAGNQALKVCSLAFAEVAIPERGCRQFHMRKISAAYRGAFQLVRRLGGLDGSESFTITGIEELNSGSVPQKVRVVAEATSHSSSTGEPVSFDAMVRIDTPAEADYFRNGGILQYVLRQLL